MRLLLAATTIMLPGITSAAELVAVKPGIVCREPSALATLTLHDGSSKTQHPGSSERDDKIAAEGGCRNIVLGERAEIVTSYRNTTVALLKDPQAPTSETYTIPNIDFSPAPPGTAPFPARPNSHSALATPQGPVPVQAPSRLPQVTASRGSALAPVLNEATKSPPTDSTSQASADAPSPAWDITGIKFDMTPDQVRAVLPVNLVVKTQPLSQSAPLTSLTAQSPSGSLNYGEVDYQVYGVVFYNNHLIYVTHIQKFAPEKQPTSEGVTNALTAKYGQRSMYAGPQGIWARDAAGQIEGGQVPLCFTTQFKATLLLENKDIKPGQMYDQVVVPSEAPNFPLYDMSKICNYALSANSVASRQNQALITQLEISMENFAPFFRLKEQAEQAAKDKVKAQMRAASQNKPSL